MGKMGELGWNIWNQSITSEGGTQHDLHKLRPCEQSIFSRNLDFGAYDMIGGVLKLNDCSLTHCQNMLCSVGRCVS